jgi:hypothetical protein
MKHTTLPLALSLLLVLGLALTFASSQPALAQDGDCGNLDSELYVGGEGVVNTHGLKLRNEPWGREVASLARNSIFWVTDGPVCDQNATWWEIENNSGYSGWIAEVYHTTRHASWSGNIARIDSATDFGAGSTDDTGYTFYFQNVGVVPIEQMVFQYGNPGAANYYNHLSNPIPPQVTWWVNPSVDVNMWHLYAIGGDYSCYLTYVYYYEATEDDPYPVDLQDCANPDQWPPASSSQDDSGNIARIDGFAWLVVVNNSADDVCGVWIEGDNYLPANRQPVGPGEYSVTLEVLPGVYDVAVTTCSGDTLAYFNTQLFEVSETTRLSVGASGGSDDSGGTSNNCVLTVVNNAYVDVENLFVTNGDDWGASRGPIANGQARTFPCEWGTYYDCAGSDQYGNWYLDAHGNVPAGGTCTLVAD